MNDSRPAKPPATLHLLKTTPPERRRPFAHYPPRVEAFLTLITDIVRQAAARSNGDEDETNPQIDIQPHH